MFQTTNQIHFKSGLEENENSPAEQESFRFNDLPLERLVDRGLAGSIPNMSRFRTGTRKRASTKHRQSSQHRSDRPRGAFIKILVVTRRRSGKVFQVHNIDHRIPPVALSTSEHICPFLVGATWCNPKC